MWDVTVQLTYMVHQLRLKELPILVANIAKPKTVYVTIC